MSADRPICPSCETHLRVAAMHCHVCGAPATRRSAGAARIPPEQGRPPVYVTTRDYGRLESLARLHPQPDHPVARFLAAELERAVVCRPEDILDDVVTMNSRVLFQVGAERDTAFRTLVYPHQYLPTGQYVSVMSPLGAALIGLREGSRMPFADLQGIPFTVAVEKVAYQPEARERRRP